MASVTPSAAAASRCEYDMCARQAARSAGDIAAFPAGGVAVDVRIAEQLAQLLRREHLHTALIRPRVAQHVGGCRVVHDAAPVAVWVVTHHVPSGS